MVEIISVVLVILAVLLGSYTSRSRRAEPDVLADLGFTNSQGWEGNTSGNSPHAPQFYSTRNLIRSESHPELTIFSTHFYKGHLSIPQDNTRIFAFNNICNKSYPKFILSPELILLRKKKPFGMSIRYEQHPDFSNIFDLSCCDSSDNVKLVTDIFDNTLLHDDLFKSLKKLCAEHITIESNGRHVFYYWRYEKFYADSFPKIITRLKEFHQAYFDNTLDQKNNIETL
jgi:hypothetical protein